MSMPLASDVIEEAHKIADRIADQHRKTGLDSDQEHAEDQVLSSLAFMYYERNNGSGSKNWDHTVGASLVDTQDAAPYMGFPEAVLSLAKADLFFSEMTSNVWRRSPSQWALSWNDEEAD